MSAKSPAYSYPYSQAAQLDPRITVPRPAIDPALAPIVDAVLLPEELDVEYMRAWDHTANSEQTLEAYPHLQHTEYTISGCDGHSIVLSVFAPKAKLGPLPAIYHIHGGGMISGDRFSAIPSLVDLLQDVACVIISIEYRLAPETRAPGAAEDCYSALVWISENAATLGIDPAEIIICAVSGGAAVAASACIMARDRKLPKTPVKAQMLLSPMLDDRCDSVSDRQFEYGVPWNGATNRAAWNHVLGGLRGTDAVTIYQAPSRATDLSKLPETYIDAGECDIFRDSAVTFAMNMWRCGATCELHIWPGGIHMFDAIDNPQVPLVSAAIAAKRAWLRRIVRVKN